MKKTILIGFALAVASSSAYAWTEISHYKNQDAIVYKIRCNNKTEIGVTYASRLRSYFVNPSSMDYLSLDAAAKFGCHDDAGYVFGESVYFQATEQPSSK